MHLTAVGAREVVETVAVWDEDLMAANTLAEPKRVHARVNDTARVRDGRLLATLPPVSWTAIALE